MVQICSNGSKWPGRTNETGSWAILQVIPIKITTKKNHVGICLYLEIMVVDGTLSV